MLSMSFFFFFNDTATTEIYTLSLHDALPISRKMRKVSAGALNLSPNSPPPLEELCGCESRNCATELHTSGSNCKRRSRARRSEEHTSELQSPCNLVCRLLLGKKKIMRHTTTV